MSLRLLLLKLSYHASKHISCGLRGGRMSLLSVTVNGSTLPDTPAPSHTFITSVSIPAIERAQKRQHLRPNSLGCLSLFLTCNGKNLRRFVRSSSHPHPLIHEECLSGNWPPPPWLRINTSSSLLNPLMYEQYLSLTPPPHLSVVPPSQRPGLCHNLY